MINRNKTIITIWRRTFSSGIGGSLWMTQTETKKKCVEKETREKRGSGEPQNEGTRFQKIPNHWRMLPAFGLVIDDVTTQT